MERSFGRLHSPDDRDKQFLAKTILQQQVLPEAYGWKYWFDNGLWNDQNGFGTCVGHSSVCWWEDSPITHPLEDLDPLEWYRQCLLRDEWVANDWLTPDQADLNFGTSVRASGKYAQELGLIGEYRWAWDLDTVVRWLRWKGPILAGTTWWWSFENQLMLPDALGDKRCTMVIDETQGVAGGHCYIWNGVNVPRKIIRVKLASWDRSSFGVQGRAVISFDTAAALLEDYGEAMMALEAPSE